MQKVERCEGRGSSSYPGFVFYLGRRIKKTKPKNGYCFHNLIGLNGRYIASDSVSLIMFCFCCCCFLVFGVFCCYFFCFVFCFRFYGMGSVPERKWEIMQKISIPAATALDEILKTQIVKKCHFLRMRAN